METKTKQKILNKTFKYLLILSFIAFMTLYLSQKAGYYEYTNHQTMALTEKEIKKFEKDIKEGKNINIEDYKKNIKISYSNKVSDMGSKVSKVVNNGVKDGIENFFGALNKLIEG